MIFSIVSGRCLSARTAGRFAAARLAAGLALALLASGCASTVAVHKEAAAPARAASVPASADADTRVLTVQPGDNLYDLLGRVGIDGRSRAAVLDALGDLFDPRSLMPGDRVRLVLEPGPRGDVVRSLHLELSAAEDLTVDLAGQAQTASARPDETHLVEAAPAAAPPADAQLSVHQVSGTVGRDFAASLRRTKLPARLVKEVTLAFRYDPDSKAKPAPRTRFQVVYELTEARRGQRQAELRYVELDDGRKRHRVYRYRLDRSLIAFVHPDGSGIALVDLAQPLAGAPVTSPWGWRIHPVLGDRRFHKGVDFGAPKGTPIRASAAGVIEDIGWRGNYGEYVKLRHDRSLETAYAHLSGFARGLHRGSKVKRGQVIGYVGSTGLSTGPHLYYEVLVDGHQVDPLATHAFPVRLQDAALSGLQAWIDEASAD